MTSYPVRDSILNSNLFSQSQNSNLLSNNISSQNNQMENEDELDENLQEKMSSLNLDIDLDSKSKRKKMKTDRFIPSRKSSKLQLVFTNAHEEIFQNENEKPKKVVNEYDNQNGQITKQYTENENQMAIIDLYKHQILGIQNVQPSSEKFKNKNLLRFNEPNLSDPFNQKKCEKIGLNYYDSLMNCNNCIFRENSPSTNIKKTVRKINKSPFKILDAPNLQDDYYLNLIDWSGQNVLAVALGSCVYLWSAANNKVSKLCELSEQVTSVAWSPKGYFLSIGINDGEIQIWDSIKSKLVNTYQEQHTARVGALGWANNILCSGSRDKTIVMRDIRMDSNSFIRKLIEHKQEVCGLKWSFDEQQVASGGNDNKLLVWSIHSSTPVRKFLSHTAAVKAIAWSPHQHGLLASGGGTADRTIRFWNTLENNQINIIDTDSQVCNLIFAKNVNEFISTHGYSMNQINIWKYPAMEKIGTLTGHTSRVLYLAMSPDGENIVSGAGDETLRFWNVFPKSNFNNTGRNSILIGDAKELR